jgi:25S rRNA (uracil2634-N3)-methyltransferase
MRLKSALASHQAQAKRHALETKAKERAAAQKSQKGGSAGGPSKKQRPNRPTLNPTPLSSLSSTHLASSSAAGASSSTLPEVAVPSRKARTVIPFDKLDTILLLGEANFSYALSLLKPPHDLSGHMICATSYDSEEVCYKKYTDAKGIVEELRAGGVRVVFGVDAGDLPGSVVGKGKEKGKGGRGSRVIFNFPHAGKSSLRFILLCPKQTRSGTRSVKESDIRCGNQGSR